MVMMYVRFPLSLGNLESLLFERGVDLPRDGAAQVEPVRTAVCCGDQASATKSEIAI
jgi:hypothetical protein